MEGWSGGTNITTIKNIKIRCKIQRSDEIKRKRIEIGNSLVLNSYNMEG